MIKWPKAPLHEGRANSMDEEQGKELPEVKKESTLQKTLIGIFLAAVVLTTIPIYKDSAISIFLLIYGIGSIAEYLKIGPVVDSKYKFKYSYLTLFGIIYIPLTFILIEGILKQIGWQWAIFLAGNCYIADAGAFFFGTFLTKRLPWEAHVILPEANKKKTWEALVLGGLPLTLFFCLFVIYPHMP